MGKGGARKIACAKRKEGAPSPIGSGYFSSQTFSHINSPTFSTPVTLHTYPPMKMEQTQCSEKLAFKIQTPGNHPEESIRYSFQSLRKVRLPAHLLSLNSYLLNCNRPRYSYQISPKSVKKYVSLFLSCLDNPGGPGCPHC
jgi:hypothetical protein